ncbi:MAG: flagellar motor protein MotB [Candidatus Eisenbacteria bacterium]|nr:flagellar motor protein MotB [Candidatus Eisenbacteria bacterium]
MNYFTRPTKSSDGGDGAPEWALTYGDMMSLLLVFFIAMAAYSTMDVVKYRSLVGSIQTAFGARDRTPMRRSSPVQLPRESPPPGRRTNGERSRPTSKISSVTAPVRSRWFVPRKGCASGSR